VVPGIRIVEKNNTSIVHKYYKDFKMTYSVKVDEAAAGFFRRLLEEEDTLNRIVGLFMKDLDDSVSSEESFRTMTIWQEFLMKTLGDLSTLTPDEIVDLDKIVRLSRLDKCSMVTQALAKKYADMKDMSESPLWGKYSILLPRINSFK
jgi:hypothetical protein